MKFAIAICALALTACGSEKSQAPAIAEAKALNAFEVVEALKAQKLPISNVIVITAENDENKLLGRPNQYISKANFFDARHPKGSGEMDEPENYVEVFASDKDAKARHDYVENISKSMPMFAQYLFLKGEVLIRLNKALTPDQADDYEAALAKITS